MRKLTWTLVLLVSLLIVQFCGVKNSRVNANSSSGDWPMFHHDLTRRGYTDSAAAITEPVVVWSLGGGGSEWTSPAIVDGVVYVSTGNSYALNESTGETLWKVDGGGVHTSPIVTGGVVYTTGNWVLNASTGTKIWDAAFESNRGIYAVANGYVYLAGADDESGMVTARSAATGAVIWQSRAQAPWYSISAAVAYGYLYFGKLALNATTGAIMWEFPEGVAPFDFSSPAVSEGYVYVGSSNNNVYCLNAYNGAKIWNYTTGGAVFSSPAVANGVVYVGSNDQNLYALDAHDGTKIWNYTTGGGVASSPAVAGGVVYVGSDDGNLYAFNALTGNKLWNYTMQEKGDFLRYSPAVANGKIYMVSSDHLMVVLGDKSTTPSPSPTPSESPPPTPKSLSDVQLIMVVAVVAIVILTTLFLTYRIKRKDSKSPPRAQLFQISPIIRLH